MEDTTLKSLLTVFIVLFLASCTTTPNGSMTMGHKNSPFYWASVTKERREGIQKLRLGMTLDEVEAILPNPYLVEAPGDGREYLLYVTNEPDGEVDTNNLTPVAIQDGKVIGWGRNFYENRTQKVEISID